MHSLRRTTLALLTLAIVLVGCDQWDRHVDWIGRTTPIPLGGNYTLRCGYSSGEAPVGVRVAPLTFSVKVTPNYDDSSVAFTSTIDHQIETMRGGTYNTENHLQVYCASDPQTLDEGHFTATPSGDSLSAIVVFTQGSTTYDVWLSHVYHYNVELAFREARPLPTS